MKFKYLLAASAASITASAFIAAPASAQSTGSVDFDESNVIIVSGARAGDVAGIEVPETPKAKQVISEELIRAQRPGQTVNDIVNLVPGVSFQNNDPWGSSGGSFTIRGFSSDRISQTVDGIPLNDSGNYALYTNQQVDPEVLSSVNVNLGSTDVDSPTASASGGTINIRTREPGDEPGIVGTMTVGSTFARGDDGRSRLYSRGFLMADTGDLTGFGTKAFVSASYTRYNNPFNNYGVNEKTQFNGRVWQDIGSNGDFVAVAYHYNENRNNFFGSVSLAAFPTNPEDRFYDIDYPCRTDVPQTGVADTTNRCGTEFDRRYNPSNTGNIRGASRFTLMDGLVLTIDPSFQYVKANGGGTTTGYEQGRTIGGETMYGYLSGKYYFGRDLNGDGDTLDQVTLIAPSETRTRRYGVISNLSYQITPDQMVRVSYTHDYANHRQTGELSRLFPNAEPYHVFPIDGPVVDRNGNLVEKRDRQSFAILDQLSGEYRGRFGPVSLTLGLRSPWFKRDLNQNCFTTSATGFIDCISSGDASVYATANPNAAVPQQRIYKYHKLLPSAGFTFDVGSGAIFGNFSEGLQVPGTDNLYNSIYYPATNANVQPAPETTKNFDLGGRLTSGKIQAQLVGWYTRYDNRLASAYDPIENITVYRNLGRVNKWGIDASVAYKVTPNFTAYVFGSILNSKIQDDVQAGATDFLATAGKRESGAPINMFGGRIQYQSADWQVGLQAKRTGKRYVNDINTASVDPYTLVDFDARWNIATNPFGKDVALQLNVTNIFDKVYVGGFGGGLSSTSPFVQIGAPRAASISLIFGY